METTPFPEYRNYQQWSRRHFLLAVGASALGAGLVTQGEAREQEQRIAPSGPGSKYVPRVWAAFVRRKGDYGMLWPGAIYDGEAARGMYGTKVAETASQLGATLNLRTKPIY